MAEPPSLGDFFAKKKTKKVKASNLNNVASAGTEKKPEKKKEKDDEAAGWREEEAPAAPAIKTGIEVGKLVREEDEVEEASSAPAWGKMSANKDVKRSERDEKRFPDLRAAVGFMPSSNINIDDGSDAKINIQTSKNAFSALEGDEEEEGEGGGKKRPKEIKPAMVSKQKGEREKDVVGREVAKYVPGGKKPAEEDEADDKAAIEAKARKAEKKAEKEERRNKAKEEKDDDDKENKDEGAQQEVKADCSIPVDEEAAKQKYMGRKKLPKKDLPSEELEDPDAKAKKPKKKFVAVEDF